MGKVCHLYLFSLLMHSGESKYLFMDSPSLQQHSCMCNLIMTQSGVNTFSHFCGLQFLKAYIPLMIPMHFLVTSYHTISIWKPMVNIHSLCSNHLLNIGIWYPNDSLTLSCSTRHPSCGHFCHLVWSSWANAVISW